MTIDEALLLLGLDRSASAADVETAYGDLLEILDEERFDSERLKQRARRQVEGIKEAFELVSGELKGGAPERVTEIGLRHLKAGRLAEAVEVFSRAIADQAHHSHYRNRGLVYLQMGEHESALSDLKTAIRMAPESIATRDSLGRLYLAMRDTESAREVFEGSLRYEPDRAATHYGLAASYALENKAWHAAFSLRRATRLDRSFMERANADAAFDGVREEQDFKRRMKELD